MLKKLLLLAASLVVASALANSALGHGGGLNSEGCHNERATGSYHCHRSSSEMKKSRSGANRLRCDLGSRSKDCTPKQDQRQKRKY